MAIHRAKCLETIEDLENNTFFMEETTMKPCNCILKELFFASRKPLLIFLL